ncbi:hypothetical protein EV421DRAFT_1897101 [Armillaria borealis]|uniref:Uncharacterized protein n=1 Tax=Armillaria borealis TaxID=47425 RepID=A0AA39K489_9AGAR|nr:hypothetical protein EV421DRAFT_1897101 [Armillaria borealis]
MLSILAVDHLEGELAFAHEAQLRNKGNDRVELAKAQVELGKLKMEDNSAAKMVSRHMKLSQAATNRLQASLIHEGNLHAATVNALTTQRSVLSSQLDWQSRANTEKLRLSLDEAGGDVIREAFGHRREEFAWSLEKRASTSGFDGGRSVLKKGFSADLNDSSESMGQIVVATLVEELRLQTARRLELEKSTYSSSSEKIS